MKRWFRRTPAATVSSTAPSTAFGRAAVPMMTTLEPRIMFDAALAATAADAAHPDSTQPAPAAPPAHDSAPLAPQAVAQPDAAPAPAPAGHTVLFVDARVQDAASLLHNVAAGIEVVVLQAGQDGLQQMAEQLASRPEASSVQIVAHGNQGDLWLGSTYLSADTLGAHAAELARIGGAMQQGGDLLIYACDTARDATGLAFVTSLAALTGRDVAASDDRTGATGDWDLEVSVGHVESVPALALTSTSHYTHDLAIITVTSNANTGVGSLRSAIGSAANGDTITFNAGMTVTLSSQLTIGSSITIDGDLDDNGTADVTLDANHASRVLSVSAGQTVTLDGLVITNGLVAGNGGNGGSGASAAVGAGISNAGTLTLNNVSVTGNAAAGGGGGGGVSGIYSGGGGGGGGGIGGGFGGTGGSAGPGTGTYAGVAGSANTGGRGGGYDTTHMGGRGGTSSGGAGGQGSGYTNGGAGGTANNGSTSIGGGGGGSGWDNTGGVGGRAVGGIYNASTGTITIIGTSVISNNLGAGGGGGGGSATNSFTYGNGGAGGLGVGGILNNGGTVRMTAANYAAMTGNSGASGSGGVSTNAYNGATPTAANRISTLSGGTTILNFNPNSAPVTANLGGDSVGYTEGGSATLLDASSNATVTDSDSADFNGGNVTAAIVTNRVSGEDVLAVRHEGSGAGQIGVSGANITFGGTTIGTLSGGTGTNNLLISLNANSSAAAVQALVRNLTYSNTNTSEPATSTRTVRITVNDGDGGTSSNADVSVSVTGVNDAPTASATGGMPTYTENGSAVDLYSSVSIGTVESGQTITGLTFTVTNLADGSAEILRIDGTDVALTNGTSGTTGGNAVDYAVSVTGSTATVTLSKTGGLSTANAQSVVDGMTYRNASEAPDTTPRVITLTSLTDSGGTSNGGADTASTAIAATVAISAVNDAPTLSGGPHTLTGTDEDTASSGTLVSTVLAGLTHADVDASPSSGIAVTASSGNGTWQYSTDGVTWSGMGSLSSSTALLLSSSSRLRYVPDGSNGESAALTFRAWDQTSGTASTNATRNTADTTTNGGTSAYSSGTAQATLAVTSVNDAPVLTPASPTLTGITDGDVNNTGQTVASIVGSSIADVDSGAIEGIAVTSLTSGTGTWQYSLDGTNWTDVGSVAASNALLLRATDRVRLVPDGVTGTTASLTYLAWDQTGATSGQQGTKVDASSPGGSTPFSSGSDTAGITVSAVNDAPVVTTSGGTTAFTESDGGSSTPVAADTALTLGDSDNTTLASATVSITGNFQSSEDVLAFTNTNATTFGNISASYHSGTGVLTLTSSGATATLAQWQAALRAVTYTNTSDTPSTASRTLGFVVNDGALASSAVTKTVSATSVNDTPVVSVPGSILLVEDTPGAVTGIGFSDADAGSGAVTATLSVGAGSLGASSGGGVTVGGTSTAMTLTGTVGNLNAYIAGGNVSYTGGLDSTAGVTLTAAINDGGNTGTGGAKTDSDTTTLQIAAVNDRPDISAPASIAITEDVAGALTGISFSDVDAGPSSVTATWSTPTGSLTASSGSGVSVSGSGTGALVLSGSVADINAYVAAGGVSYTTPGNSAANVVLTVQIDDGGHTGTDPGTSGTGSSEARSTTVTLIVSAVNDAPVNSVPAAQSTDRDVDLVFSTANANLISTGDVDVGSNPLEVTLTATQGRITLAHTSGLTFSIGTGTIDSTMAFTGSAAQVNSALDGLVFLPTAGYTGPASLQIVTSDQGQAGSGGAASDTDTIAITVNAVGPEVTSVSSATANGTYKAGDTVVLTAAFDQTVIVDTTGGAPTLLLETGTVDHSATYVSGSGTSTLSFHYVVQGADASADLDYASTSALALNGATIRNASGNDALLTLPSVGGSSSIAGQHALVIDGIAPTVTSVSVPADGTYAAGQALDFTVHLSEAVVVDTTNGSPRIAVTLDTGGTVNATYVSGSGTNALLFRSTLSSGQFDGTGITVGSAIDLQGATLADVAGNAAVTTLHAVGSTSGVLVDALAPTVASVAVPADAAYRAGDVLVFTVNTSEPITVTGTPRLALDVGGSTVHADYVSGSGSTALRFQYTVQTGDDAAGGLAISALDAQGSTLRDAVGNDLALALHNVGATGGVVLDNTTPAVTSIVRVDSSPTRAGSFRYTVTFSEDVSGVDASDFSLVATDHAAGTIAGITAVNARTYTVLVDHVSGEGTLGLDLHGAATGIADAAGNPIAAGLAGQRYVLGPAAAMTPDTPAQTAEPPPSPALVLNPPALPVTLHPTEPISPVVVHTMQPAAGSSLPSLVNASADSFSLPMPGMSGPVPPVTGTDVRSAFVELGAVTGGGLRAIPDIGDFSVPAGERVQIALPSSTFTHGERNAQVSIEARLADGRPLPAWLKFDPVTGTLTGQPPRGLTERLAIEVIARDQKGHRAVSHLDLQIGSGSASPAAPVPRPADRPHSLLIDPEDAGEALAAAAAALHPDDAHSATGRSGLSEQFARFGAQARMAERTALLEHARATASHSP